MCNKATSEQHFAVTIAERAAVFHGSLRLVREEAGAQLSNKDNEHLTSHG